MYLRKAIAIIGVLTLLASSGATAKMKLFPIWDLKKCGDAEFACYNKEQIKDILKIDLDLQLKLEKLESCSKNIIDLKLSVKNLNAANTLLQSSIGRFKIRLKEKDEVLNKNTNLMIKYQQRDIFGGALPWAITIVVVVAAGSFIGGYYIGTR